MLAITKVKKNYCHIILNSNTDTTIYAITLPHTMCWVWSWKNCDAGKVKFKLRIVTVVTSWFTQFCSTLWFVNFVTYGQRQNPVNYFFFKTIMHKFIGLWCKVWNNHSNSNDVTKKLQIWLWHSYVSNIHFPIKVCQAKSNVNKTVQDI